MRHPSPPSGALALAFALLLLASAAGSVPVSASSASPNGAPSPLKSFALRGTAPQDLQVVVTFALPLRNLGALDSIVTQVSDPSSVMFRHFLTPAQVRGEFLPTVSYDSLLQKVLSSGLTVEMTALDSVIVAQGTVAQLGSSFGTGVDLYSNGTSSYYVSSGPTTVDGAYLYASNATYLYTRPATASTSSPKGNVTFTSGTFPAKDLQPVYNATSLYARGYSGSGQTIGLLDFYGSPTIASDLNRFDSTFGFPNAKLNVIPVGPYDPNIGASVGWSTEVSLDVEVSHAMAPSATLDLYVANGALTLAAPLAKIVQDDNVTTLSQSFGTPEWYFSQTYYLGGPSFFAENVLIPDQYYALGSVEGISFLASTGDAGGGGYSAGPEGGLEYPATSPFVTSVGGTQTYFAQDSSGGQSFVQSAWSNIGFVPNGVNEGGGGGGVSILEPKPWYQLSQPTPPSYPNGRLNPDLSLQAGIDPATLIVDSGRVVGIGGTSESSPLLAGLLTLVAESAGGGVGLVNPFLYQVGNSPADYAKGFDPITSGYIIPWTASPGFNLATGWGAPNIGELSQLLLSNSAQPGLGITGTIFNASGLAQVEYVSGQSIDVQVQVTRGTSVVSTGSFTAALQTLSGSTTPVPMTYDAVTGNWTGSISVASQSGVAYLYVSGTSGGVSGSAMGIVFAGYLGSIVAPTFYGTSPPANYILPTDPWTWSPANPLPVAVVSTDLFGNPAPSAPLSMTLDSYSIKTNSYSTQSTVNFLPAGQGVSLANLTSPVPAGPVSMVLGGGTYGYAPIVYGLYLQTSYIYPEVAAEPGSAAPGQSLTIIADPIAPVNVYFNTALETGTTLGSVISTGSNFTASLVSPSGQNVAKADLYFQPCAQALRVCNGGASVLYGQVTVPAGSAPGLYTVDLNASFDSYSLSGPLTGSFYGQVMVSRGATTPSLSLSTSVLYEGQQATLSANIAYPNGTEVKFGEYSAAVYPSSMSGDYTTIVHSAYANGALTPLTYDATLNRWVGLVSLPSTYSSGSVNGLAGSSIPPAGPFDVFVSGISYDGVPTSTGLSSAQQIFVQPYLIVTSQAGFGSSMQSSGLAFDGVTITGPGSLSGDLFLGSNTVQGATVTISDSQIQGTLTLVDSTVTLVGVTGGNLAATHSTVTVHNSALSSIQLTGSNISLTSSAYGSISPSLPSVTVVAPAQGGLFTGGNVTAEVAGSQVSSVQFTLDGSLLQVMPGGQPTYTLPLNTTALSDGAHTLTVVAKQSDGLSSTSSVTFSTDAQVQAKLDSQANALNSLGTETELAVVAVAVLGFVALVAAVVSLGRSRNKGSVPQAPAVPISPSPSQPKPPEAPPPSPPAAPPPDPKS